MIRQAISAVPSVRYALGVVGTAAAAALVYGLLGRDPKIAVFGPLALLLLMVLPLLFAKLSSHYLIGPDGRIFRLVHENDLGIHAGNTVMPPPDGRPDVNRFSVGIELVAAHPDDDPRVANGSTPAYTEEQYLALERLLDVIHLRCAIPSPTPGWTVVGHNEIASADVRGIAGAKKDPGPAFAWDRVRDRQKRMRVSGRNAPTITN